MGKHSLVFVGTQMFLAGSQKNLLTHAEYFHQQGHSVQAVFFYDKQNLHETWQDAHSFPIINLAAWQPGENLLHNLLSLIRALLRFWQILREVCPQVVETFTPDSNLLGLPLAWLSGVPVRIATHRAKIDNRPSWYPRLHGLLINFGIASTLIAVSEDVRRLAIEREKVKPERVQVILNAVELPAKQGDRSQQRVELRQELGLAFNTPIVLTVGRLTKQKGQTYLLQAIPAVLRACPEAAFVFVGDGPLKTVLQAEARQLRVAEWVHFLGLRQDVSKLLQAADIFVLPSLWEGMSMALLEAMAEEVPVVVSDVEGINDLITDQVEGLVVPPRNPDALAKAVTSLLGNEDLREQLSQAAYKKVQREFSLERMSKQYENVFWGLLKNRSTPL